MATLSGFTLTELLIVMALLAVMTGMTAPSFRALRLDASRTSEVNQFVQAIHLARSEAMKRNTVVSLCPSSDLDHCAPAGMEWQVGWILFVNRDGDSPAVRDADETLVRAYPAWTRGRILANRSTLSFRAFGQAGVTATYTFCDTRGNATARAVIISQTGRPRVSNRSASGDRLSCT